MMKLNVKAVKLIIAEKQLTFRTLAELAGIAPQNLSTILKRGTCYMKTGAILAEALGVSIEEIWKED